MNHLTILPLTNIMDLSFPRSGPRFSTKNEIEIIKLKTLIIINKQTRVWCFYFYFNFNSKYYLHLPIFSPTFFFFFFFPLSYQTRGTKQKIQEETEEGMWFLFHFFLILSSAQISVRFLPAFVGACPWCVGAGVLSLLLQSLLLPLLCVAPRKSDFSIRGVVDWDPTTTMLAMTIMIHFWVVYWAT